MKRPLPTLAATLSATPASAHLDPAEHDSLAARLSHPVFGLDHILAKVAVGLGAASLGGRALRPLPTAFGTMIAGFAVAVADLPVPFVELMILVEVFAPGLAVAPALRLPVSTAALVAAFGLFQRHAHRGEPGAGYGVSTALLHAVGISVAAASRRAGILKVLAYATALGGRLRRDRGLTHGPVRPPRRSDRCC